MDGALLQESRAKLNALALKDLERQKLEHAKNELESYIYFVRNKLIDDEEQIKPVTTEEQMEELRSMSSAAEDWLYDDGYTAGREAFEEKLSQLTAPMSDLLYRVQEVTDRPAAVAVAKEKLEKVRNLMKKWESTKPQVTELERMEVLVEVEKVEVTIVDKVSRQEEADPKGPPVFMSSEVKKWWKDLEIMVTKLNK
mmetsp:Transcript_15526/g.34929  ORF Transcript_15526/g.34929 Transcript_15526/m.34929 type:complete len:197 (+) Transcript_15526:316-906(+)